MKSQADIAEEAPTQLPIFETNSCKANSKDSTKTNKLRKIDVRPLFKFDAVQKLAETRSTKLQLQKWGCR